MPRCGKLTHQTGHIGADAELDDDWAEEAGRDAEDKYFGGE